MLYPVELQVRVSLLGVFLPKVGWQATGEGAKAEAKGKSVGFSGTA